MLSKVVIFRMPERQHSSMLTLKEQTGIDVSEWLRRFIDHCTRPSVLNELAPAISGQIKLTGDK